MTSKYKELLIKDLCCRLPYNVICKDTNINVIGTLSQIGLHYNMCSLDKDDGDSEYCHILNCKAYLFPLSSMTEEQTEELIKLINTGQNDNNEFMRSICRIEFYHKHHLDYRGLIPKNLAIDATGKNIY